MYCCRFTATIAYIHIKKSEYFLQNTYMRRQNVVERCTTAVLAEEYVVIMEYCAKAKITL